MTDDNLTMLEGLGFTPVPQSPSINTLDILGDLDVEQALVETAEKGTAQEEDPKRAAAAMLLGGAAGAALGNFIPDPGDIAHILGMRYMTQAYRAGTISEARMWATELALYYLPSFSWWSFVAYLTYKTPGLRPKIAVAGGAISAGAVVSLILSYILREKK